MKTIDMKIGNKVVSFTTKSVTIDRTEYSYSKMSGIKHNSEKHVYAFKYDGAYKYLPYDPKYAQVLAAIFKQVNALDKKRQAILAATQEIPMPIIDTPVDSNAPSTPLDTEVSEAASTEATEKTSTDSTPAVGSEMNTESSNEGTANVDDEIASEADAQDAQQEEPGASGSAEEDSVDPDNKNPQKKAKLVKSLLIFLAIIVIIGALTAAYFAFFGTTNNPIAGPNSTDSQQYDIDKLIEDLE